MDGEGEKKGVPGCVNAMNAAYVDKGVQKPFFERSFDYSFSSPTALSISGRTGKQCRERWHNHLDPNINKNAWTEKEEKIMSDAHRYVGPYLHPSIYFVMRLRVYAWLLWLLLYHIRKPFTSRYEFLRYPSPHFSLPSIAIASFATNGRSFRDAPMTTP